MDESGTEDPVRLGSIGLGWWGTELAHAATRSGARITACFARTQTSRAEFAARHSCRIASSVEDLLSDPSVEGVLLATPHSSHVPLIEAAAAAGKHVFVEKPLALDYRSGKRAVDAAASAGVLLQVGHNRRRQPAVRRMRSMIDAGDLGLVHHVEGHLSHSRGQSPRPSWREDPAESPAGGMTGLGVHLLDSFVYLVGEISSVVAFSKRILRPSKLDDVTTVMLEFASGPLGSLEVSLVIPEVASIAVFGSAGAVWSEDDGARVFEQRIDEPRRREVAVETASTLDEEIDEFVTCIRSGGNPEVAGTDALHVVLALEAIVESIEGRCVIDLAEIVGRSSASKLVE